MSPINSSNGGINTDTPFSFLSSDPTIVRDTRSNFFKVKNLSIYGHDENECRVLYGLYKGLEEKGDLGKLVRQKMSISLNKGDLAIIGFPTEFVPHHPTPDATGAFHKNFKDYGLTYDKAILIPLKRKHAEIRLAFGHESVHYLIEKLTPNGSVNLFSALSEDVKMKFLNLYKREEIRFFHQPNPFATGSREWNIHNYLKRSLFMPLRKYGVKDLLIEIPCFAFELELGFEGGILKKFAPELEISLKNALEEVQKLPPLEKTDINLPSSRYPVSHFGENIQTMTLDELNKIPGGTKFQRILKSVGNATKKAIEKSKSFVGTTLNVLGKPKAAIPIDIIFAYEKDQEHALERAIFNGTGAWSFGNIMSRLIGNVSIRGNLVIGVGTTVAEILPDLHELRNQLPTQEEIKSLAGGNIAYETFLQSCVDTTKAHLTVYGHIQKGFKSINPVRIWNEHVKNKVDNYFLKKEMQEIGTYLDKNPSKAEQKWAEILEEVMSEDYLKELPLRDSTNSDFSAKQSNPPPNPSEAVFSDLNKSSKFEESTKDILGDCSKEEIDLDPSSLQDQLQGLERLSEQVREFKEQLSYQNNSQQSKQDLEKWQNIIRGTEAVFNGLMNGLRGAEQDKQQLRQFKDYGRHLKQEYSQINRQLERQDIPVIFDEIRSRFHSPYEYFNHLHQMVDDYKKDVHTLSESLKANRKTQQHIQNELQDVARLDSHTQKIYLRAIEKKQKLGGGLRIFAEVVKVAGTVMMFVPGLQIAGMAATTAGSAIGQVSDHQTNKHTSQLGREREKLGTTNLQTAKTLQTLSHELKSEENYILNQQAQMRFINRQEGERFLAPDQHQDLLKNDIQTLNQNNAKIEETTNNNQEAIDKDKRALKEVKDKASDTKKKKKKVQLEAEAKKLQARILEREKDSDSLRKQKHKNDEEIKGTQDALGNAEYLAPARQIEHDILNEFNPKVNESEEVKKSRERAEAAISQYHHNSFTYQMTRQQNRQQAADLLNQVGQFADVLSRMSGTQKPAQLVSFAAHIWQMRELYMEANKNILPNVKAFIEKHPEILNSYMKGQLSSSGNMAFAGLLIYQILIPLLKGFSLLYGSFQSGKSILTSEKMEPLGPSPVEIAFKELNQKIDELRDNHQIKFSEINDAFIGLSKVNDQILREVEEGFQLVLRRMDKSSFNQYIKEIKAKVDETNDGTKAFIEGLQSPILIPADKRIKKMRKFLLKMRGELDKTLSFSLNGFELENCVQAPYLRASSKATHLNLLYKDPASFTGFMANYLENGKDVPQWRVGIPNFKLLCHQTQSLIDLIVAIRGFNVTTRTPLVNILQNTKEIKEEILTISSQMKKSYAEVENLYQTLFQLIKQVVQSRDNILKEIHTQTLMIRFFKGGYSEKVLKNSVKSFLNGRENIEKSLVCSGKFFLYRELNSKKLIDHLPSLNALKIYDQSVYGSDTSAKAQRVAKFLFNMAFCGIFTAGLIPAAAVVKISYDSYQKGFFELNDLDRVTHKIKALQPIIDNFGNRSFKDLYRNKSDTIAFSELNQRDHHFELSLDLMSRSLESRVSSEDKSSHIPFASIDVDMGVRSELEQQTWEEPSVGIELKKCKILVPEELEKVPNPNIAMNTFADYDESVKKLVVDYFNFIECVSSSKKMDESNPFTPIKDRCQIVPSFQAELPPLGFPNELMAALERLLNPDLRYLEAIEAGTLVPYYDFDIKTRSLVMHFQFISVGGNQERKYGSIKVADFDVHTMRAFQKDLRTDLSHQPLCEFLIQAMYGSFGTHLGLPGEGTYTIQSGLFIAPQEIPFPGLYKLWELWSENLISYRSNEYTEEKSASLVKSLTDKNDKRDANDKLFKTLQLQLGEHYQEVWLTIYKKKQTIKKVEEKLNQDFSVFFSMVKLLSNINYKELFDIAKNEFNVFSSIQNDEVFEANIYLIENNQTVSDNTIQKFIHKIKGKPSELVSQMQAQQKQLAEIEHFITQG